MLRTITTGQTGPFGVRRQRAEPSDTRIERSPSPTTGRASSFFEGRPESSPESGAPMLKIALPNKGRLADDVRELFADAGLEIRVPSERALSAVIGDEFQALFVRAQDIPEFVADGAAHAGITGRDLVKESGRALDDLLDLEFGKCRLVVAAREEGFADLRQIPAGARVASCFPNLTRAFFSERDIRVDVVPMSGAAEVAPHLGIAEVIVDLTSTGSTLKTNGLRELATLLTSTARLVARADRDGEKRQKLGDLTMALASVLRARGKRYV